MSTPHNPPAFPLHDPEGINFTIENYPGMTLRDYFAAKAMAAIMAGDYYGALVEVYTTNLDGLWRHVASSAYNQADAMLAERSKG